MFTLEEIEEKVVEYRKANGLPKLSPSRLRNKVENYARQLGPKEKPKRSNDPTGLEVMERAEKTFAEFEGGVLVRPLGFRAKTTSQYGNPLYVRGDVVAK